MAKIIDIKVGPSCNNRCIHCLAANDSINDNLQTTELIAIIDNYISRYGKIDIVLTGGEITFRKDYYKIMKYLKKQKECGLINEVHLQTNGRRLGDHRILEVSIDVVDYYLIALHSSIPIEHDAITRVTGSFQETIISLSKLIKFISSTKSIAIQTVINRVNFNNLMNTYRFAYETFGITEYNITFPHPMAAAFNNAVTPMYSEVKESVNIAMDYFWDNCIFPLTEALPYCVFEEKYRSYVYQTTLTRTTDVVGYAGHENTDVDYAKVTSLAFSKYVSCQNCPYDSLCNGVWNEYRKLYPDDNLLAIMT